ncbi:MAG: hypothetical protein Q7Q73_04030 [Verrucomicrobiota bacterium JB024]|nr:hypothetical protein [Verrucomicrobiota bacterium JB024]
MKIISWICLIFLGRDYADEKRKSSLKAAIRTPLPLYYNRLHNCNVFAHQQAYIRKMGKNDGKTVRTSPTLPTADGKLLADSAKGDFVEFVLQFGLALAMAV